MFVEKLIANTKIKTKFIAPLLILIPFVALFLGYLVYSTQAQYEALNKYVSQDLGASQNLFKIFSEMSLQHGRIHRLLGDEKKQVQAQDIVPRYKRVLSNILENYSVYSGSLKNPTADEKALFNRINGLYIDYHKKAVASLDLFENHKNLPELLKSRRELQKSFASLSDAIESLMKINTRRTERALDEFKNSYSKDLKILFAGLAFVLVGLVGLSLLMASILSKPLTNLVKVIGQITDSGDYSLRAPKSSDGEVGVLIDGFNQMLFEIQRMDEKAMDHWQKFKTYFEKMPAGVLVTNKKGFIKTVNQSFVSEFGIPPKILLDQPFNDHIEGEDAGFDSLLKDQVQTRDASLVIGGDRIPIRLRAFYLHHMGLGSGLLCLIMKRDS